MIAILLYFLSMGLTWSFALFMWFGCSLDQKHFTHSGNRQKLGNFRGLEWALVYAILNRNKYCNKVQS